MENTLMPGQNHFFLWKFFSSVNEMHLFPVKFIARSMEVGTKINNIKLKHTLTSTAVSKNFWRK